MVIDANQLVETQQAVVRELVSNRLDLARFERDGRPTPPPPAEPRRKTKVEEPAL